jgi:hypothetical protein
MVSIIMACCWVDILNNSVRRKGKTKDADGATTRLGQNRGGGGSLENLEDLSALRSASK